MERIIDQVLSKNVNDNSETFMEGMILANGVKDDLDKSSILVKHTKTTLETLKKSITIRSMVIML